MKTEYFLLGEVTPVRVRFNEVGHRFAADVPSREKRELAVKVTYLSRLQRSFEVDRITEVEFWQHCSALWDKWGTPE